MRSLWQWSSAIELGVEAIDNQHKELINHCNLLNNVDELNRKKILGDEAVNYLMQYINEHFEQEEALQQKVGYPRYEAHKKLHKHFTEQMEALKSEFDQKGMTIEAFFELSTTLNDWIVTHIGMEDKALADFIKSKESL